MNRLKRPVIRIDMTLLSMNEKCAFIGDFAFACRVEARSVLLISLAIDASRGLNRGR